MDRVQQASAGVISQSDHTAVEDQDQVVCRLDPCPFLLAVLVPAGDTHCRRTKGRLLVLEVEQRTNCLSQPSLT